MVKIQNTVLPDGPLRTWSPKHLTIGQMEKFWEDKGRGHFNQELYKKISRIRAENNGI